MSRVLLNYPHRMGGHCGSGALRDLCEWRRLGWDGPPREGLVFVLGGDLSFRYARLEAFRPPIYLVGRGGDLETKMLSRIGAQAQLNQTDDPALGWAWTRQQLDAGNPVLVWADIAELPYLRVRLQMSRHDIVIIGYDDEREEAYVVDNDREAVQSVPYEALRRARTSQGFPIPTRNATYEITWPSKLPDVRQAAATALSDSAKAMTATALGGDVLSELGLTSGGLGLDGLTAFAADIDAWPDVLDEESLTQTLRALPAFIEKAGTGGGLFRRLQSEGLRDLAELTHNSAVGVAADAYAAASTAWTHLSSICASADPPSTRVAALSRVAFTIAALEREAVSAMSSASIELSHAS